MANTQSSQLKRKLLTLYGDRAWQPENPGYIDESIVRGYDNLNRYLQGMLAANLDVEVLCLSYSNVICPYNAHQGMFRIFMTILYTGEFQDLDQLPTFQDDEGQPHMYLSGRGTMIRVQL